MIKQLSKSKKRKISALFVILRDFLILFIFLIIGLSDNSYLLFFAVLLFIWTPIYASSIFFAKDIAYSNDHIIIGSNKFVVFSEIRSIKRKKLNFILNWFWGIPKTSHYSEPPWDTYTIDYNFMGQPRRNFFLISPDKKADFVVFIQMLKTRNNKIILDEV